MNGIMNEWKHERKYGWMNPWNDSCMNEWNNECMKSWMNEWMEWLKWIVNEIMIELMK